MFIRDYLGFPGGAVVKNPPANARDMGLIPELERSPVVGNDKYMTIFLPGKFHGQRTLVAYCPWNHKESVRTEHIHIFILFKFW